MATKSKRAPQKTETLVNAERVRQALQARGLPIRGLTAETLASNLEAFDLGYLRNAALLWQKIRDRDDTVKAVTEKRELDTALLPWEILPLDDSPEANKHKEALEAFYNNACATHALDQNQRGGVATLIRQMMHSVGHKYAVHEIVWDPTGPDLTAEFRFTPLQFFENTLGQLRFLETSYASSGVELEEAGWMVTVGAGLMEATSIAYLFKNLPLKSWLVFCDKFGIPGLHGETSASYGSAEWNRFRDALANFAQDWALLTSTGGKITPIEVNPSGTSPHKDLVDRMDRAISRLWRGADLGTMSQDGAAVGSNPQKSETDILAAADAMIVSETLNYYVDRFVIGYRFGTTPKAYFKLQPPIKVNQELELKIDDYLIKWGVPRGKKDLLEKYNRPEPDAADELASAPVSPAPVMPFGNEAGAAGRQILFQADAANQLAPEVTAAILPILRRLAEIDAMADAEQQRAALTNFRAALPELTRAAIAKAPAAAAVLEKVIGTAFASGAIEAEQARQTAKASPSNP